MATSISQSDLLEEIREIRDIVQDYKPGKNVTLPDKMSFPENLFIGLFGRTGCGKSSLINSLKFAVQGRLRKSQWIEVASQEKAGGHTMFRKIADLTQCIYVIDNRGLDNPSAEEVHAEIAAQLDGDRGYSEQVQWLGEEVQRFDIPAVDLKKGHPITCVVFVFSAIHDIKSDFADLNLLVDFLHRRQGCYPIAVITHVDVAERNAIDILLAVLRVSGIADIYEVANITSDKTKLDAQYQLNLLNLIERCMTIGNDTAVFKHYQRVELEQKTEKAKMGPTEKPVPTAKVSHQGAQSVKRTEKSQEWEMVEGERREVEKLKNDLEKRRIELGFQEQDHKMKMDLKMQQHDLQIEFEKQQHDLQIERQKLESREMQLQEEERERRFQEQLRKIETDKREDLMHIMEANRSQGPRFHAEVHFHSCTTQ